MAKTGIANHDTVSNDPRGITTPINVIRFNGAVGFIFASK